MMRKEKCECCGQRKREKAMLYVVGIDKYFCGQGCFDGWAKMVQDGKDAYDSGYAASTALHKEIENDS